MLHLHLKYIKCLKCMCVRSAGAYTHCMCRLCMSRFLARSYGAAEARREGDREENRGGREEGGGRGGEAMHGQRGQT